MNVTSQSIAAAIARINVRMPAISAELDAADAKLGDGDTGTMLARLVQGLAEVDLSGSESLQSSFSRLAKAASATTGSSLGTLVVVALMVMAKASSGKTELSFVEFGELLVLVRDGIMSRGQANLGDKSVVDALDYLARALATAPGGQPPASTAIAALEQAIADFRDRPSKLGRARLYGAESVGLTDPGMLALHLMVSAIAGQP
ncbi:DAK2 domain-containing protein [Devosia sp. YIM 151766]|uniref:DAK2 domain-containing protein n=1 Tax=Devosia sp. YIM 151766 TaxID=3017325 RepID=UPI00255CBBE0|nr:DAK2 domain-containing protein [Devosia sp. YIM 151766]WIY52738.1 DAK2 domain-containing protein [Devosia sp. YIM 151766]